MASAGSPAIATPSMARMNRNIGHSPTNDDSSVSSAAASSERLMIGLRDHPSATAPMTSIETARLIFQKALEPRATWLRWFGGSGFGVRGFAGSMVRGFTRSTAGEGETDAERHQDGAGDGFDAPLDAIRQQDGRHAIDEPCVDGQPDQAHDDVHGGEEDGLGQDRAIGDDELREERDVEDRDLRVQEIGKETLNKADMTRTYRA